MPKVEQFGQNINRQVVSQTRAPDLPSGAFGADIGRAVSGAAQTLSVAFERANTTKAEEALVQFEREKNQLFFNPESGYFNTQGRNAFEGAEGANTALLDLQKKYSESLMDSPEAQRRFKAASDVHVTRGNADIMRHSAKGFQAYEVGTLNAQTENTLENAALYWNDQESLQVQAALGEQSIIDAGQLQGLSAEEMNERLQTYRSTFAGATIEAATVNSYADGKEAMDKYGSLLEGPIKVKMDKALDTKQKAEKTANDARVAVSTASRLVYQYESRSDIIDEVNQIDDLDLRDKTMREAMYQFNQRKNAISEERAAAFEMAEGYPSAETFKAENPDEWEKLSPKQQKKLESGEAVTTDWVVFNDLMLLPKKELAKVDPNDHLHHLAPKQRQSLVSAVRAANGTGGSKESVDSQVGRTRAAETTEAVEIMFGKKTKRSDEKQRQVQAFYTMLTAELEFRETEKGSALSSEEYSAMLNDMTRKVAQDRSFIGIPLPDAELEISDIPAEYIAPLTKELHSKGYPATADNLLKAYQQAK